MEFVTRLEILLPNSDAFIKMIAKILMPTRVTPRMDNEEFFSGELSGKKMCNFPFDIASVPFANNLNT